MTDVGREPYMESQMTGKTTRNWGDGSNFLCLGKLMTRRATIVKARLVILFALCAIVMVTAVVTWKISEKAANSSIGSMSAQLRADVMKCAVTQLKDLLLGGTVAMETMYRMLVAQVQIYSRDTLLSDVLPTMWATFSTHDNVTSTLLITHEGLLVAYRRDGREGQLSGNRLGVAVPSLPSDPSSIGYGYIPDNITGAPLLDRPVVKICLVGSCPEPLDLSVYQPTINPPLSTPVWLVGRGLPKGEIVMSAVMGEQQEPILSALASIKGAGGETAAVLAMTFAASKLHLFLKTVSPVQVYGGHMFITVGPRWNILSTSSGPMFMPPAQPSGPSSFMSVFQSSDQMMRNTAIYLNNTFGREVFHLPTMSSADLGQAGTHYINTVPLLINGLQLLVVLAVPHQAFYGPIEEARQGGLIFTMITVIAMFLIGGVTVCISTRGVSKKLEKQERDLDEAATTNRVLMEQLQIMMNPNEMPWPKVDMGTPLEKLTTMLKGLQPGQVVSHEYLQQMQALIMVDDLHEPQFLAAMHATPRYGVGHPCSGGKGAIIDSDIHSWIQITTMGRRPPARMRRQSLEELVGRRCKSLNMESPKHMPVASTTENRLVAVSDAPLPGSLNQNWAQKVRRVYRDRLDIKAGSWHGSLAVDTPPSGDQPLAVVGKDGKVAQLIHFTWADAPPLDMHLVGMLCSVVDVSLPLIIQAYECGPSPSSDDDASSRLTGEPTSAREYARLRSAENSPVAVPPSVTAERIMNSRVGASMPAAAVVVHASLPAPPAPTTEQIADAPPPLIFRNDLQRVQVALRVLGEWEFDTLALAEVTMGHTVPLVGYSLFVHMDLVRRFGLPQNKLMNFLHHIGRGMGAHPYHNAAHISEVSASLFHVLTHSGVGDHLRSIDKLAALVAALIHDYKHPGVNNDFLNRTRDELATIYNDRSPLENYHLAEAFHLLYSNEHCNFLEVLAEEDFMELRHIVIEMVLMSDMKRHFGVLDAFKARVSQDQAWDMTKSSDRLLLLQLSLKICDLGHCAKPLPIHLEWSRRVNEEFYLQGDAERAAQLHVSPFMDRFNNSVPRSQLGFFQFLAVPLYDAWVKSFPKSSYLITNIMSNIDYWKEQLEQSTTAKGNITS
eukprot:jgi/Mesvir1/5134/Mv25092-RA.1